MKCVNNRLIIGPQPFACLFMKCVMHSALPPLESSCLQLNWQPNLCLSTSPWSRIAGDKLKFHAFYTSAVVGGELLVSSSSFFTPLRKIPMYQLDETQGRHRDMAEKNLFPTEIRTFIVQPVYCHFTDFLFGEPPNSHDRLHANHNHLPWL